jgi:spore germination protein YaaH
MKKLLSILFMLTLGVSLPCMAQDTKVHTVNIGEDFQSIAAKYGITEQQLKDLNPKNRGVFYVGMKLNVPASKPAAKPAAAALAAKPAMSKKEAAKAKREAAKADKEAAKAKKDAAKAEKAAARKAKAEERKAARKAKAEARKAKKKK